MLSTTFECARPSLGEGDAYIVTLKLLMRTHAGIGSPVPPGQVC